MHTPQELEARFWKALKSDMTVMLGLNGAEDGHTRPMTAQLLEDGHGPLWFFTSKDNKLVNELGGAEDRAIATFASKGHDLFATVNGRLSVDNDRAVIDKLWNKFVAAWFEGKDDPKLVLLRLDPEQAEIWLDGSSVVAGMKMLLGVDPKRSYKGSVATVSLRN